MEAEPHRGGERWSPCRERRGGRPGHRRRLPGVGPSANVAASMSSAIDRCPGRRFRAGVLPVVRRQALDSVGLAVLGAGAIRPRAVPIDEPHVGGIGFSGPTTGDLAAIYWNPAALGLMHGLHVTFSGTGRLSTTTRGPRARTGRRGAPRPRLSPRTSSIRSSGHRGRGPSRASATTWAAIAWRWPAPSTCPSWIAAATSHRRRNPRRRCPPATTASPPICATWRWRRRSRCAWLATSVWALPRRCCCRRDGCHSPNRPVPPRRPVRARRSGGRRPDRCRLEPGNLLLEGCRHPDHAVCTFGGGTGSTGWRSPRRPLGGAVGSSAVILR